MAAALLSNPNMDRELVALLSSREAVEGLRNLGVKSSHINRNRFEALVKAKKLSHDAKLVVYMLAAKQKNRRRLLDGFNQLPEKVRAHKAVEEARNFIAKWMCQWVTEESDNKFALIHLSATNPTLTSALWLLSTPMEERVFEVVVTQQWFAQLALAPEVQAVSKAAQKHFWEEIITVSTSTSGRFKRGFDERIYAQQAKDTYPLARYNMETGQFEIVKIYQPKSIASKSPVTLAVV